ncbi:hypothetical protein ACOME3_006191 [Neoechinorhynchus agilis]
MFLTLIAAFWCTTIGKTNQRTVVETTSPSESERYCIRYDVLAESLSNPLSNLDLCGDPLRIYRVHCFDIQMWPDEETNRVCFSISYTLSAKCEDRVIYGVDLTQKVDIVSIDNYGKYLYFLLYGTVRQLRHILETRWPNLLRKEIEQTTVFFVPGCPKWRNYIQHTYQKNLRKD